MARLMAKSATLVLNYVRAYSFYRRSSWASKIMLPSYPRGSTLWVPNNFIGRRTSWRFDDTTNQVHFDQNATFSIDLQLGNFCSSGIDFAKQQKNCCQTLCPFSSQNLRLSSRNFHRPQDSSSSGVSFNTLEKKLLGWKLWTEEGFEGCSKSESSASFGGETFGRNICRRVEEFRGWRAVDWGRK